MKTNIYKVTFGESIMISVTVEARTEREAEILAQAEQIQNGSVWKPTKSILLIYDPRKVG